MEIRIQLETREKAARQQLKTIQSQILISQESILDLEIIQNLEKRIQSSKINLARLENLIKEQRSKETKLFTDIRSLEIEIKTLISLETNLKTTVQKEALRQTHLEAEIERRTSLISRYRSLIIALSTQNNSLTTKYQNLNSDISLDVDAKTLLLIYLKLGFFGGSKSERFSYETQGPIRIKPAPKLINRTLIPIVDYSSGSQMTKLTPINQSMAVRERKQTFNAYDPQQIANMSNSQALNLLKMLQKQNPKLSLAGLNASGTSNSQIASSKLDNLTSSNRKVTGSKKTSTKRKRKTKTNTRKVKKKSTAVKAKSEARDLSKLNLYQLQALLSKIQKRGTSLKSTSNASEGNGLQILDSKKPSQDVSVQTSVEGDAGNVDIEISLEDSNSNFTKQITSDPVELVKYKA